MARVIEEKILDVFFNGVSGIYNLSRRDRVEVRSDSVSYYLWGTELVRKDSNGNIYLFPSSIGNYYGHSVSQTTHSRLNAFIRELLQSNGFYQKNIARLRLMSGINLTEKTKSL